MSKAPEFDLSSGALCLDFVNTLPDRPRCANEGLSSYLDLLAWGKQAGALDDTAADRIRSRATARPEKAARALQQAMALRESLYRLFSAVAAGDDPQRDDLAELNRRLARAMPHLRVTAEHDRFGWQWEGPHDALDRMLWSVVRSAAELLTSDGRSRVHECQGRDCSWMFIDYSRNRRRRWCDMKSCGNRAKARRHYQRLREAKISDDH